MSDGSAWVCGVCQKSTAGFFCTCESPEVFLCELCIGKHYACFPTKLHRCLPVAAFGDHAIPGYFERFTVRAAAFAGRAASLRTSLDGIDQCCVEFNQEVDQLIHEIEEYRATILQKLRKLKEELSMRLETACKLVEETFYADKDPSDDPIVTALRNSQESKAKLSLFSYQIYELPVEQWLQQLIEYEETVVNPENEAIQLPYISGNCLCYIGFNGERVTSTKLPIKFESATTIVVLINNEAILVDELIFALDIASGGLTQVGSRLHPNINSGVYADETVIHLFGGKTNNSKSVQITNKCEKFNTTLRTGAEIRPMNSKRADFNPVKYQSLLYLPHASSPLETFDFTTEAFATLKVENSFCSGPTVSFIAGTELIVLSLGSLLQCRLDLAQGETSFRIFTFSPCASQPVFSGGILGCVVQGKKELVWQSSAKETWKYDIQESTIIHQSKWVHARK